MSDSIFGVPLRRFLLSPPILRQWPGSSAAPMDWIETQTSHILRFNVPGFGKEEIKVQVLDDDVLHIRGESAVAQKEDPGKDLVWHAAERGPTKGEFTREFVLPDRVRVDQIKAHVKNGVLTVVVPKEPAPAKPKPRSIPISSKL